MSPRFRLHHTQGQSVVLFALVLFLLVGVAGLGLDGTNAFNQRRNVANAADAASMAGTKELIAQRKSGSHSNTAVCQAVSDYITNHKLNQGIDLTWTASYVNGQAASPQQFCDSTASPVAGGSFAGSSVRGVLVDIHYTFGTMFMGVFGRSSLAAGGTATALYGPLSSYTGGDVVPFAISQNVVDSVVGHTNVEISITKLGAGNFGGVNFNPSSPNNGNGNDCTSSTYKDTQSYYWCNGSPKYPVYIGEDLPGNPGMVSNGLSTEIGTRIGNTILMPVFSGNAGTGANATFKIVGFLAVKLNSKTLTGPPEDRGFNVDYVSYTTSAGAFSSGSVDGGVYAINLVK